VEKWERLVTREEREVGRRIRLRISRRLNVRLRLKRLKGLSQKRRRKGPIIIY
jgi:hypothetical protein